MRRRLPHAHSVARSLALATLSLLALAPNAATQQRPMPPNASARALATLAEDYWQWRLREYP